jgi:DNA topoisomerase-1
MIRKQEAELANKNNTSDVALGTSKLNYIDPRITLAWLKEWDDRLVAMAMGSDRGVGVTKKVKKEKEEDIQSTKKGKIAKKQASHGSNNSTGDREKMEIGLQVMNISQFFANALQKKFRWAASDDDGRDITAKWVFVKDAQSKMRKFESAERKGGTSSSMAAMTDAADAGAVQPQAIATLKKQTAGDRSLAKPIQAVDEKEPSDLSDDDDKPLAVTT